MSHIVTIETEVRDQQALGAACRRLKLSEPVLQTVQLFSGQATGYCVQLPDWRYPVVCDLSAGRIAYDHFQGRWGVQRHLDALMQSYAVEKSMLEARLRGHTVTEQPLADGSIRLSIQVGGSL